MDYKKAYFRRFNAITECIGLLQAAQVSTEEMYLETGDDENSVKARVAK